MSDSVRPHRQQPTRLPRPWDSPDKNTGVGCHFLLQWRKVKSKKEVAQSCPTSWSHGLQPTRLLHPWDFPGKSTGVGCHCLLRSCVWLCCNPVDCSWPSSSVHRTSQARTLEWAVTSYSSSKYTYLMTSDKPLIRKTEECHSHYHPIMKYCLKI